MIGVFDSSEREGCSDIRRERMAVMSLYGHRAPAGPMAAPVAVLINSVCIY